MESRLHEIMEGAGLSHLMSGGRRKPYEIIASLMSKNKLDGYKKPGVKPFSYSKLDNPSEDIQRKYGVEEVKRFDYCKAQKRREAEEERVAKLTPEERRAEQLADLVREPEYWGLTWSDLTRQGNWYVTKDELRFPPVKWINPLDKKAYWALANGPGLPSGDVKYNRDGKVVEGKRKRINYDMLYFKEGEIPSKFPSRYSALKRDVRIKNGIKLIGTNAVRGHKGNISTGLSEEKKDSILPVIPAPKLEQVEKKIEKVKEEKKDKKETLLEKLERIRGRISKINDELYGNPDRWDMSKNRDYNTMFAERTKLNDEKEKLIYEKEEIEAEMAGKKAAVEEKKEPEPEEEEYDEEEITTVRDEYPDPYDFYKEMKKDPKYKNPVGRDELLDIVPEAYISGDELKGKYYGYMERKRALDEIRSELLKRIYEDEKAEKEKRSAHYAANREDMLRRLKASQSK